MSNKIHYISPEITEYLQESYIHIASCIRKLFSSLPIPCVAIYLQRRHVHTSNKIQDLGLTISADMKVSEQCGIAAAKGNQILGLIRRNIVYKETELTIPLYKTIVRPHLEYYIQAWRPYRKKDIDMLERVQRRATKMKKNRNQEIERR